MLCVMSEMSLWSSVFVRPRLMTKQPGYWQTGPAVYEEEQYEP
jgi:hypothetical protein